jgi:ectoine hydroxylase-related dioxygenase (phytanoyl-CoA dioxygenase family)
MATFALTDEQRDTFDRDGVVCLRGVMNEAEVGDLRGVVDRQIAERHISGTGYDFESIAAQIWERRNSIDVGQAERFDVDGLVSLIHADAEARPLLEEDEHAGDGCFFYDVAGWRKHQEIRRAGFDSALPPIVADLLASETLNFWEDTTFVKAPHTRQKTAFHQDLSYFQIEGDQCAIVWIPLDPANKANGITRYVKGSHKWGETYAPNMFVSQTLFPGAEDPKCPDIEANEDAYDIVSFDVQPGDVIIHHVLTVHGAGGNTTSHPRRAISFRYTGDNVRYHEKPGAMPQPSMVMAPEEGARLHTPDYPIVWPKPWPSFSVAKAYDKEFAPTDKNGKRAA